MNIQPLPVPFGELHEKMQQLHGQLELVPVFKNAVNIKFEPLACSAHFDTLTSSELASIAYICSTLILKYAFIAGKDTIVVRFYIQ